MLPGAISAPLCPRQGSVVGVPQCYFEQEPRFAGHSAWPIETSNDGVVWQRHFDPSIAFVLLCLPKADIVAAYEAEATSAATQPPKETEVSSAGVHIAAASAEEARVLFVRYADGTKFPGEEWHVVLVQPAPGPACSRPNSQCRTQGGLWPAGELATVVSRWTREARHSLDVDSPLPLDVVDFMRALYDAASPELNETDGCLLM